MTVLDKIIQRKKEEITSLKAKISIELLKDSEFFGRENFSLKESINNKSGIIAEFKRQSPSKGIINDKVSPLEVVSAYESFGANGISILTDKNFFGGSNEDILNVRNHVNIPILRKDFILNEYQIYEAKSIGADVILLIASCLTPIQVQDFTELSHELGLEVLLEIHTEEELQHFNSKVDLVGINNRNLKDFKVDLQHSVQLKNQLPKDVVSIAESGIYSIENFKYLKGKGFDGFLMGEYFMKNKNPAKAFEEFISNI
ncbi:MULTISPECIES: indole-3-glycerol phosphate synthase TrpC [Chryseobacterium]|uniref:Indole-3-glycerol phosphate synthase n=1 Tax=Chryseobacterium geocarposphaerae TaxID=1416776 RepID=A0ABU1L9P3_9FLAO|nr:MULTISPECIES: indole-3-glycerol phosphate synthase TrpC [Chryseobacterium]MDR6403431.1 indole-3-glycerol phosphate synthase [Chryseobacterium geocarposphaerae]MDR6696985.1 indole-3-glycerol phosphate synthase [Chryseobacterium ginsenosidimutans]